MTLTRTMFATAAGIALIAAPAAAFADPPHCPPGHAKKGWCGYERDSRHHDGWDDSRDAARAYREGYEDGRRDQWRAGQYLPRDIDYRIVRDYERYGYGPPPRGYEYYEVDGEILLIQTATRLIAEALR